METRLLKIEIRYEHDVVLCRQRARQVAGLLGFKPQDQVRIATVVSEIARNAFRYGGGGKMEFLIKTKPKPVLRMILTDHGPGIPNLQTILEGKYLSQTGMGIGILGAKKLMDRFQIDAGSRGTTVWLERFIPDRKQEFNPVFLLRLAEELSRPTSQEPFVELQQQNQELLAAFGELEKRQNELTRLNGDLREAKAQLNLQNEQLESRVSDRTAELKQSLKEMERFCYSIAHDLKAPLRAIHGFTSILKEDYASAFDEAGKTYTASIAKSAARMAVLIENLLDYGRLTHIEVPFSVVDLKVEIDRTLDELRAEILSRGAEIEVQKRLPKVVANPILLHQALHNLIDNGLKFMKPGVKPRLQIGTSRPDPKSNHKTPATYTRLWIRDNGIGIDPSYKERIFKVFERLHAENSLYPGTGIGLALVQKAVERMNGVVGVESVPGQGSLFWIELPQSRRTLKPTADRRSLLSAVAG